MGAVKVSAVRNDVCHYGHTTPSRIYIIDMCLLDTSQALTLTLQMYDNFCKLQGKSKKTFACGQKFFVRG